VDENRAGRRLDVLLAELVPGSSRALLARAIRNGLATLDGKGAKPSAAVRAGQILVYEPARVEKGPSPVPGKIPVGVIFRDGDLLVIDKPAGLAVHPGAGFSGPTLVDALLFSFPELAGVGPPDRPGIVHRLDRVTSGVMCVAGTERALAFLTRAFADRRVHKRYLAFVRGDIPDRGRIDSPIGRHPTLRHRMRAGNPDGREASTLFRTVRRFPASGVSLVLVTLLTGRTHQARVHLASVGAPVLGDPVYGKAPGTLVKRCPSLAPFLGRQMLHARTIAFPHPSGGRVAFSAPWPDDFRDLLKELLRLERPGSEKPESDENGTDVAGTEKPDPVGLKSKSGKTRDARSADMKPGASVPDDPKPPKSAPPG
jgi:23S rRNA pseudouridine1911/1915/1917 synthase